LAERCARALAAGCEMMLHCAGFARDAAVVLAEMREVAEASPELAGSALARALAAEAATGHAMPFDPDEAWSRLRALLARAEPGVA
jgi:beta-N-acetylhexosaminidase